MKPVESSCPPNAYLPSAPGLDTLERPYPAGRRSKRQAPAPPAAVTGKLGEKTVYLGERNLVYSVVRRDTDGTLERHCVNGSQAAQKILDQPAAAHAEPHGDDHHAHR